MIKLPWTSETSPSLQLEINHQCNMSCRGCYKSHKGGNRSLEAITRDLDIASSRSRLHTVSISGAETTLHSGLCDIVRLVHDRGLKTVLISNGLLLDDKLLRRLRSSGLDAMMLHVDEGQERPDLPSQPSLEETNALRARLAARVAAHDIAACLVVTLYREHLDRLPGLVRFILASEHIDLLLVTHYVDFQRMVEASRTLKGQAAVRSGHRQDLQLFPSDRTTNQDSTRILQESLGLKPFAYLPASGNTTLNETISGWITYFVPVIQRQKEYEFLRLTSGVLESLLMSVARLLTGRHVFYFRPGPMAVKTQVILNALSNGKMRDCMRFLTALRRPGSRLTAKRLVFDNGPVLTADGRIVCADYCPTRTVKGEAMVPICMCDFEGE